MMLTYWCAYVISNVEFIFDIIEGKNYWCLSKMTPNLGQNIEITLYMSLK